MTDNYHAELGGQPSPVTLPTLLRGCGPDGPCAWPRGIDKPDHPDGHVCPWRDSDDGRVIPCGCTHAPKGKL